MSSHYNKALDNRLAAIEGHVRGVRQMLADGKECEDILLQISALSGSINKVGKLLLKEHEAIYSALKKHDKTEAGSAIRIHIENQRRSIISSLRDAGRVKE